MDSEDSVNDWSTGDEPQRQLHNAASSTLQSVRGAKLSQWSELRLVVVLGVEITHGYPWVLGTQTKWVPVGGPCQARVPTGFPMGNGYPWVIVKP